ncbi:putative xyloglucan galactosyltransferase GT14, partial [Cucurbita argyrosperma subsp. sororia]
MEKKLFRTTCSTELWFAIFISFAITWIFLCFDYSTFHSSNNGVLASSLNPNRLLVKHSAAARSVDLESDTADPCSGRYLFIQDIPSRFNSDLIRNCQSLTRGTDKSNMCPYLVNFGLGPEIEDSQGVFSNNSWFKTNQFLLEVIFHNKMKQYKCLTNDSAMAAAVYVPFYAGLDISHYLWNPSISVRDSSARDFLSVISEKPEWKRMFGRDHFFIAGRISWDFRRKTDDVSDWGSKLRFLPESHNMTMLSVEASSWKNDFAIPYPTYFHPLKLSEVVEWQSLMRTKRRRHLFTFAGAPRPELRDSIRGSAYSQYLWHFPENRTAYSVYIPVRDVKNWNESIEGILNGIPKDRESAMREEVIRTIPRIVYADPRSKFRDFEDAFDLAVKGILERVEDVRRKIRDGKDPSEGFDDPDHFKYTFSRKI